jgi:hypothetical protein
MEANSLTVSKAGRTDNGEAHDLYMRGRFLILNQSNSEEGMRKGLDYLKEALKKDPGYAPAYATTALAYSQLADAFVTCDYRKLGPRATGFFEGVVASLQRATRVMVLAIGDRTRSHGRWCS